MNSKLEFEILDDGRIMPVKLTLRDFTELFYPQDELFPKLQKDEIIEIIKSQKSAIKQIRKAKVIREPYKEDGIWKIEIEYLD